ncbi:MAG TPA: hypothetical protein VGN11_13020 [Candidatus Baltobacteraceae bacterium]|jgi:hypothetical protein|nr:hypothetical protein [Candidatus Baltobacteraceae bacterium]
MDNLKRDRDREIFQNDLTENEGATPAQRESADHDLNLGSNVDSQEDDAKNRDFAEELRKTGHGSGH